MHPQLISGLPIQTFGLCVGIGVLLGWALIDRLARPKDLGGLMLLLVFAGIFGARVAHVIEYWHADGFDRDFVSAFQFWKGGLVFYGGFIAAFVAYVGWVVCKREPFFATADIVCVALPLGHAFGRLGCFFNGCCWGKPSSSFLAVTFPRNSLPWDDQLVHGLITAEAPRSLPLMPTQLIEAAALLALCAALYFTYRRYRRHTAALYLIGYGALRFFIEFLRADERPDFAGLSSAQCVSIGLLALGLCFLICSAKGESRRSRSDRPTVHRE